MRWNHADVTAGFQHRIRNRPHYAGAAFPINQSVSVGCQKHQFPHSVAYSGRSPDRDPQNTQTLAIDHLLKPTKPTTLADQRLPTSPQLLIADEYFTSGREDQWSAPPACEQASLQEAIAFLA